MSVQFFANITAGAAAPGTIKRHFRNASILHGDGLHVARLDSFGPGVPKLEGRLHLPNPWFVSHDGGASFLQLKTVGTTRRSSEGFHRESASLVAPGMERIRINSLLGPRNCPYALGMIQLSADNTLIAGPLELMDRIEAEELLANSAFTMLPVIPQIEYMVHLEDGRTAVVLSDKVNHDPEGFRVFLGTPGNMVELVVTNAHIDEGTRVTTAKGEFWFPGAHRDEAHSFTAQNGTVVPGNRVDIQGNQAQEVVDSLVA